MLIGAHSVLGWWVLQEGHFSPFCNVNTKVPEGHSWQAVNLQDEASVAALFERYNPDLIVDCSGVCNIGKCQLSPEFAYEVNVNGVRNLTRYMSKTSRLVYCSNDHVFGGASGPQDETSVPNAISVYGETRAEAESLVLARVGSNLVLRASLCIGSSYDGRTGHLDWLRYRHNHSLPMTVIEDEERGAVSAQHAAQRVIAYAHSDICGIRHVVASRTVSRKELAQHLVKAHFPDAQLQYTSRHTQPFPHLGKVELVTCFNDDLAAALPSALDI